MIDARLRDTGLEAPAEDEEPPSEARAWRSRPPVLELKLADRGVSSIIWATGFTSDFGWLEAPVVDARGVPIQQRGVTPSAGLYFLGLRRMYKPKSSFLFGVGEDAAYIAEQIAARG
jgi:putative flavoprotein involved in K+ transport